MIRHPVRGLIVTARGDDDEGVALRRKAAAAAGATDGLWTP
jgi:hypothetical protein